MSNDPYRDNPAQPRPIPGSGRDRLIDPRAIPVRYSNLRAMSRSPAHYLHAVQQGRSDSPSMKLGRIVHWRTLDVLPDDEPGTVVVWPGERRGNAWIEFAAEHPNDEIVTVPELERADPIARAVQSDPVAAPFLVGVKERRIDWSIAGRACTSRPDVVGRFAQGGMPFVADLKTTGDASEYGFQRHAFKMLYHAQLAFYVDAYNSARLDGDPECEDAYLIAVETNPPHAVTVHRVMRRLLDEGRKAYRAWFERLIVCESSNDWPSYSQHVCSFDVPEWFDGDESEEEAAA